MPTLRTKSPQPVRPWSDCLGGYALNPPSRAENLMSGGTEIQAVIRKMWGGAQSSLVSCNDGRLYIMKMSENPQGENLLANELLGAHLLHGFGISSPNSNLITVTAGQCSSLAFELRSEKRLPLPGVHFGSEFLSDAEHRIFEWLPENAERRVVNQFDYWGIYVFDIWVNHQDQRQCIYRQNRQDGRTEVFFVDNGHLFGGPEWKGFSEKCRSLFLPRFSLAINEQDAAELWISHMRIEGPPILHEGIRRIPTGWYKGDIGELERVLVERLANLSNLVQSELRKAKKAGQRSVRTDVEISLLYHRDLPDGDPHERRTVSLGLESKNPH
jgi:hypothetical protein